MGFDPVEVRLGDPPLAGDAFVDQGLAVGGKGGDLSFDGSFYSVTFLGPSLDFGTYLFLLVPRRYYDSKSFQLGRVTTQESSAKRTG
jgi:hypothetical protein